tara:strand:+ start:543 stop:896 length:354 start_codon:yes stop_codon:yes gene_type:complete
MSNQVDPYSNYLNIETIQTIDKLNLPIRQKHHVRILAHCLVILKSTYKDDVASAEEEKTLREWCDNQSKQFNDKKFNDLLYEQLSSASTKLSNFSRKIGKNINDLNIEDLIALVKEC